MMKIKGRSILICLGFLAVLAIVSVQASAVATSSTSSTSTSTTEPIDYNLVTCFTDKGCMMPLRGPPYCLNGAAVRDVRYGSCEDGGTLQSRCVQKTNVTVLAECAGGQRCQGGRCVADDAQSPQDIVVDVSTTETSTTFKAQAGPSSPVQSSTTLITTTTMAAPSVNQTLAVQTSSPSSNLVWVVLFVVLALLILAAAATAALLVYFVYKKRQDAPQGNRSAIHSNSRRSALNTKYLR